MVLVLRKWDEALRGAPLSKRRKTAFVGEEALVSVLFKPQSHIGRKYLYFIDEETEGLKSESICPRSHSWLVGEPWF